MAENVQLTMGDDVGKTDHIIEVDNPLQASYPTDSDIDDNRACCFVVSLTQNSEDHELEIDKHGLVVSLRGCGSSSMLCLTVTHPVTQQKWDLTPKKETKIRSFGAKALKFNSRLPELRKHNDQLPEQLPSDVLASAHALSEACFRSTSTQDIVKHLSQLTHDKHLRTWDMTMEFLEISPVPQVLLHALPRRPHPLLAAIL